MRASRLPTLSLLAVLVLLAAGCAHAGKPWVEIGGERFQVEVARDDRARAQGLMFRESMPAGDGMLFIHEGEEWLAYWMKNTLIPLDILYFDAGRRLVTQQRDVPPCKPGGSCSSYPSDAPAKYVLELNAGQAERLDLQTGAALEFGPGVADE